MLTFLTLGLLVGCAGNQDPWGDPESGLILSYRMPEGQTQHYAVAFDQSHTLSAQGQERSFGNGRTIDFSATPAPSSDGNLPMTITIDAMTLTIDTPRGSNELDVQKIREQSFDLTLSPSGEVVDIGKAAEITYFLGGAGEQGIDNDFRYLFPVMPEKPLQVGDSWTHPSGTPGKSFNPQTFIDMRVVNTLAGYETIDGMECAKISSEFSGELVTEGDPKPGMAISGGPVTGSGVWYFAYKEGLLVKASRTVVATTEVQMGGPGTPPVPAAEETKIEIGLVTEVVD
jgi:hypothetical protein